MCRFDGRFLEPSAVLRCDRGQAAYAARNIPTLCTGSRAAPPRGWGRTERHGLFLKLLRVVIPVRSAPARSAGTQGDENLGPGYFASRNSGMTRGAFSSRAWL